ncbi:MAG: D-alanine--D-alanine ligase [Gammaproteobacteria bacterium]|nr:D-alanine--D-alanine ligase [Gammaproteobacteria bacterium]
MKVAVIGGGTSPEAEVSRVSAIQVVEGLKPRHEATYIEFDAGLHAVLQNVDPEVVFPVLHGVPGEDGSIQGYLEVLGIPFVGSGMTASALAIDKYQAKCVWRENNIPVLPMKLIDKESYSAAICQEIEHTLGHSVAIKPRAQGSALGVRLLQEGGDVGTAIEEALETHDQLLVEPFTKGREITVAVLERDGIPSALPIIEIQVLADGEWYDFTNRYKTGASQHILDPPMPSECAAALKNYAVRAHRILGCRDLSRADFIVDEHAHPWLLEINTIPGMTPTSLFPDAARGDGMGFPDLMDLLVTNAFSRR